MQDGDHQQQASLSPNRPNNRSSASGSGSKTNNETVRVRWKPTPQQITILEHIFNSGTVNPPKDVTTNIRKQLEQFGPVEDVNIFYWFQNRRSRWSRRLRQMRSDSAGAVDPISSNANSHINFSPPLPNHEFSPQSSFFPDYNANIHTHNYSTSSSSSTNHNYEQNSGVVSSTTMFPQSTNHASMPNHQTGMIPLIYTYNVLSTMCSDLALIQSLRV